MHLPRLDPDPGAPFPAPDSAWQDPNGLLAWGGDLSPTRMLQAYRSGIFPWYSEGDPILWWSPDPRGGFDTGALHLSRRLRRRFRQLDWIIRADRQFREVVRACATVPRKGQPGTWILPEMQEAYAQLHAQGQAHSIEVHGPQGLLGGVYGVHAGSVFCGESMFGLHSGASTLALAALCRLLARHGVGWLDAQFLTPHLTTLGARRITRRDYLDRLAQAAAPGLPDGPWTDRVRDWKSADFG